MRHIRDSGVQTGIISSVDLDVASLVAKAKAAPPLVGRDLVQEVTCSAPYDWKEGYWQLESGYDRQEKPGRYRVVAYDRNNFV